MELSHRFTVPVPVDVAWEHFQDVAAVAECFPGATVTSVADGGFAGSVKVKLGPIALVYNGSGTFTERDDDAHRFVVEAKGKDKRGNGTAGATVTLAMAAAGGATEVSVDTDLSITGKPAQFGRGVMQDVSDKLLGQFVDCLEQRLSGPAAEPEEPTEDPTEALNDVHIEAPAVDASSAATKAPTPSRPAETDDALDLGATVIPVLARAYWKQLAAAVGALGVVVVIRRILS